MLHARRHRRAGAPQRRARGDRTRCGGVAAGRARAGLRGRERLHQGREDHPELHGNRGPHGVEKVLAVKWL